MRKQRSVRLESADPARIDFDQDVPWLDACFGSRRCGGVYYNWQCFGLVAQHVTVRLQLEAERTFGHGQAQQPLRARRHRQSVDLDEAASSIFYAY